MLRFLFDCDAQGLSVYFLGCKFSFTQSYHETLQICCNIKIRIQNNYKSSCYFTRIYHIDNIKYNKYRSS